ncbi:39S ribosomal protein L22, mitochondrial-like protein [Euroglyphus maynei]|uniref:Large ribosomal subunit protein uL22m n=1 Tax=Euroglyphus maynei TaxID=6958 RepID=A0A1Y3BN84_EURMA|nr:39S ribosomal protein L22, mitochondrial-like protein [Euroglyphus maynei]
MNYLIRSKILSNQLFNDGRIWLTNLQCQQRRFESNRTTFTKYDTWTYQHDQETHKERLYPKPKRWPRYNEIVHPPEQGPVERYYCHYRENIKYSPKKMFFVASFIRGMSIDEAIKQLSYVKLKGGAIVKEILQEAQQIAVNEHNFEFKSNMWIAESFCTKGVVFKGFRKHARMRFGEVRYFHCHYFVKLVEGTAPEHYYPSQAPYPEKMTIEEKLEQHIEKLRQRRIDFAL